MSFIRPRFLPSLVTEYPRYAGRTSRRGEAAVNLGSFGVIHVLHHLEAAPCEYTKVKETQAANSPSVALACTTPAPTSLQTRAVLLKDGT